MEKNTGYPEIPLIILKERQAVHFHYTLSRPCKSIFSHLIKIEDAPEGSWPKPHPRKLLKTGPHGISKTLARLQSGYDHYNT
jgi:hypothetical protein